MLLDRLFIHRLYWRAMRPQTHVWHDGPLMVMPGVLDPVTTKVGAWLAEAVAAEARPGERWLDLGCGTGIVGLALAEKGATVTCADIDVRCVQNAALNAELRELSIDCVQSDLFSGFKHDSFDTVAFNLPFWPGEPRGPLGRAFHAGDDYAIIRRFVSEFRPYAREARVVISERHPDFAGARDALGSARLLRRSFYKREWIDLFAL